MPSSYADLQQLVHRFYHHLDERKYHDLVAMMRPDATWHRQGKVLRGRDQVLAALNERPPTLVIRHIITNTFLEHETDNDAQLIAYMTAYRYDDGKPATARPLAIDSPYRVLLIKKRFVRVDGQWWIAESAGTTEFEFTTRA